MAATPAITPAMIDSPAIRSAPREMLSLALMDARNHTLQLLSRFEQDIDPAAAAAAQARGLEPPLWIAGHIGWLAEYWIGRNPRRALGPACTANAVRLASIEPMADRWFDPSVVPPATRWAAPLPGYDSVRAYLLETLESTLELLEKAGDDDQAMHFYRAALVHEDVRGEQLVVLAQALGIALEVPLPPGTQAREPLLVPAQRWLLGAHPGGFVPDIEKWAHEVEVPEFEIDAQPVNWGQFAEFVDDGGYDTAAHWQPQGWQWLEREAAREGRRGPRHVEQIGSASGAVMQMLFGRAARMSASQNVMHVSWWEADAFSRWAGRRLPTEVEWELAAHATSRRGFRWGDVREWTAGSLRPWPGFAADPWTAGTPLDAQPWLGRARAQRGASFATRARMKHPKMRGFAMPEADDAFVGFRTCSL